MRPSEGLIRWFAILTSIAFVIHIQSTFGHIIPKVASRTSETHEFTARAVTHGTDGGGSTPLPLVSRAPRMTVVTWNLPSGAIANGVNTPQTSFSAAPFNDSPLTAMAVATSTAGSNPNSAYTMTMTMNRYGEWVCPTFNSTPPAQATSPATTIFLDNDDLNSNVTAKHHERAWYEAAKNINASDMFFAMQDTRLPDCT